MSKLLMAISFQKPKKRPLNYNVNTLYPPKIALLCLSITLTHMNRFWQYLA